FAFLCLLPTRLAAQPTFRYFFDGPWRVDGPPSTSGTFRYDVMIAGEGLENVEPGVQGWSVAVAADGCRIVGASTRGTMAADGAEDRRGLRQEGYESTQLTDGEQNEGVVSAVVLSFRQLVTLPLDGRRGAKVLVVTAEATYPAEGEECYLVSLRFQDGLRGTGNPVSNRVTYRGQTFPVEAAGVTTRVCPSGPFALRFGGELRGAVEVGVARTELRPVVLMSVGLDGVQGWSLSVESVGESCEVTDATTRGTVGAEATSGGLRVSGFEKTELAPPEINGGRTGALSAVVLSFVMPVILPQGEHAVLALRVNCDTEGTVDGDFRDHRLRFTSNFGEPPASGGLRGAGQPVKIAVTFRGTTVAPGVVDADLELEVRVPRIGRFVRCDPNDDGRNNLGDVIWIVNELFRSGRPTLCREAADCNADGLIDLADAVFAIAYRFLGGSAPPAPFPDCGLGENATEESCPAGSSRCSGTATAD
ncbi:MAG: hypothetical protein O7J95_16565, partial [Planctomycetota bacterium]|nr:hypothetical protein [Planctomycetota bacterium]